MKKLFAVSVIFLIIGVGSLAVSLYLYRIHGQRGPAADMGISGGVAEEEADTRIVYKKPETVDRSTPDKTIQSYWEYLDYVRSAKKEKKIKSYVKHEELFHEYLRGITPIEQPFLETFLSGQALEARLQDMRSKDIGFFTFFPREKRQDPREAIEIRYRRTIDRVELVTDTRAEVTCTIYNITPLDNLKQPLTDEETEWRKLGRVFVYTLEQFKDGWKIIGRKATCVGCRGTGYRQGKTCWWCDGSGWHETDVLPKPSSGDKESHHYYHSVDPEDH